MENIDLTKQLIGEKRVRKLNRFSVSEMYYLLAGWTPIEEYVKGKEFTVQEAMVMLNGMGLTAANFLRTVATFFWESLPALVFAS